MVLSTSTSITRMENSERKNLEKCVDLDKNKIVCISCNYFLTSLQRMLEDVSIGETFLSAQTLLSQQS